MKHIFLGRTREGKVSIPQKSELNQAMAMYPEFTLTLEKRKKKRSVLQNSLMHAYFQEIADQTKMHYMKVKKAMKAQFLTVAVLDDDGMPIVNPVTGEVLTEVRDTSDLSTTECSEFCENIRLFMMDFGVYLKSPGENEELKFKD